MNTPTPVATDLGDREQWRELQPFGYRLAQLDAQALLRLRRGGDRAGAVARVPSGALVSRTVVAAGPADTTDRTVTARDFLQWLADPAAPAPIGKDAAWRGALPPALGWRHVDDIPEAVIADLVRQGARLHVEAASRDLAGRAANDLLDLAVLTVTGAGKTVELTNRSLSAVMSMGFLPVRGHVVVAVSGRWTRLAAPYGSVFAEQAGPLNLLG